MARSDPLFDAVDPLQRALDNLPPLPRPFVPVPWAFGDSEFDPGPGSWLGMLSDAFSDSCDVHTTHESVAAAWRRTISIIVPVPVR